MTKKNFKQRLQELAKINKPLITEQSVPEIVDWINQTYIDSDADGNGCTYGITVNNAYQVGSNVSDESYLGGCSYSTDPELIDNSITCPNGGRHMVFKMCMPDENGLMPDGGTASIAVQNTYNDGNFSDVPNLGNVSNLTYFGYCGFVDGETPNSSHIGRLVVGGGCGQIKIVAAIGLAVSDQYANDENAGGQYNNISCPNQIDCSACGAPGCEDEGEIYGCTDSEATNYNEEATLDDGSCEYGEDTDDDDDGDIVVPEWDNGDLMSCCELADAYVYGGAGPITYPAINYLTGNVNSAPPNAASSTYPQTTEAVNEIDGINPGDYGSINFDEYGYSEIFLMNFACVVCQDLEQFGDINVGNNGGNWSAFPYCACCEELNYSEENIDEVFGACEDTDDDTDDDTDEPFVDPIDSCENLDEWVATFWSVSSDQAGIEPGEPNPEETEIFCNECENNYDALIQDYGTMQPWGSPEAQEAIAGACACCSDDTDDDDDDDFTEYVCPEGTSLIEMGDNWTQGGLATEEQVEMCNNPEEWYSSVADMFGGEMPSTMDVVGAWAVGCCVTEDTDDDDTDTEVTGSCDTFNNAPENTQGQICGIYFDNLDGDDGGYSPETQEQIALVTDNGACCSEEFQDDEETEVTGSACENYDEATPETQLFLCNIYYGNIEGAAYLDQYPFSEDNYSDIAAYTNNGECCDNNESAPRALCDLVNGCTPTLDVNSEFATMDLCEQSGCLPQDDDDDDDDDDDTEVTGSANCQNFTQEIQNNSPELEDIGGGLDDIDAFCQVCDEEPELIGNLTQVSTGIPFIDYCDCCDDTDDDDSDDDTEEGCPDPSLLTDEWIDTNFNVESGVGYNVEEYCMWCNGEIGVFIEDGNDELCPCCEGEPDEDTTDDDDEFSCDEFNSYNEGTQIDLCTAAEQSELQGIPIPEDLLAVLGPNTECCEGIETIDVDDEDDDEETEVTGSIDTPFCCDINDPNFGDDADGNQVEDPEEYILQNGPQGELCDETLCSYGGETEVTGSFDCEGVVDEMEAQFNGKFCEQCGTIPSFYDQYPDECDCCGTITERFDCVMGWGAAEGQSFCQPASNGEFASLDECEQAGCGGDDDDACPEIHFEYAESNPYLLGQCCHYFIYGDFIQGFNQQHPAWPDVAGNPCLEIQPPGGGPSQPITTAECCEEEGIFGPGQIPDLISPDTDQEDPTGATADPARRGINVNTPGAPQPRDYKGGGTDPQYLKDKAEFIKKMGGSNTISTPLRERLQKLAGINKKLL